MNPPKASAQPLDERGYFTVEWYRFLSSLQAAPAASSAVTLSASPSVSSFTSNGFVLVTGGTVSAIAYRRGASGSFVSTGLTAGQIVVRRGDAIQITYTVAPTVTFFPD